MVDLVFAIAIVLLLAGVVASVVPVVPGGVFTMAGLLFYWWQTGEPGTLALLVLVLLALTAIVLDYVASAVSAKAGGASWGTAAVAAVVGILLALVTGPLGLLAGIAGVVFLIEFLRHGDVDRSAKAAAYTTAGMLVSTVVRVAINLLVLVLFVLLVVVF